MADLKIKKKKKKSLKIKKLEPLVEAGIIIRRDDPPEEFKKWGLKKYELRTPTGQFRSDNLEDVVKAYKKAFIRPDHMNKLGNEKALRGDHFERIGGDGLGAIGWQDDEAQLRERNAYYRKEWEKWKAESLLKLDRLKAKYPAT